MQYIFLFSVLYSSYIFLLPRLSILFSFLKAFCLLLPLIFRSLLNLIACYCPFLHLDLTSMSVTVSPGFLQKKEIHFHVVLVVPQLFSSYVSWKIYTSPVSMGYVNRSVEKIVSKYFCCCFWKMFLPLIKLIKIFVPLHSPSLVISLERKTNHKWQVHLSLTWREVPGKNLKELINGVQHASERIEVIN